MKVPTNKIAEWGLSQLQLSEEDFSAEKLPVRLEGVRPISVQRRNILLKGEPAEVAEELCRRLLEEGAL